MQPKLNLFIDLQRRMLNRTGGRTSNLLLKGSKSLLSSDAVLTHYHPALPIEIACDASSLGKEGTLFHRYPDGSERPIANIFKILFKSQRNYSQIQKEALAIVFAVKKFFQFCLVKSLS